MFRSNLWCYLWDLVDEGIEAALDVIQGQLGATGISVATSYHSVEQLRPHAEVSPRIFRSEGGLNFQPDLAKYSNTRMKPVVAAWLSKRNPLRRLVKACEKRDLRLRSWTVCCHSSLLVRRHPETACKDVFGQVNPTWLCPVNPDVAEFLRALVADLSQNYPFEAIELESATFDPARHYHAHRKTGLVLGEADRFLLGLCFCESCRQQAHEAGVDVAAVARSVQVRIEKLLDTGQSPADPLDDVVQADEYLRAFTYWRTEAVERLVSSLRLMCSTRLVMYRMGDALTAGADWKRLASVGPAASSGFRMGPSGAEGRRSSPLDALMVLCYRADVDSVDSAVAKATATTGAAELVELGFDASPPATPDAPTLVRNLTRAAELGVRSVNIYNYGLIPPGRFSWVRQAIRAGGRTAQA